MPGKSVKVLIVDDELLQRRGIRFLLDWQSHGYEIVGEASNGLQALKCVKELKPDIVITDILMPDIDGIELTNQIKINFPKIKVLILTGYDNFEYIKNSFKNGAYDYLLKPNLTPETLLNILDQMTQDFDKDTDILVSPNEVFLNLIMLDDISEKEAFSLFEKSGTVPGDSLPFYLCAGDFTGLHNADSSLMASMFLHEIGASDIFCFFVSTTESDMAFYILFQSTLNMTEIKAFLESKAKKYNDLHIGMCHPFEKLSTIAVHMQTVKQLCELSFFSPETVLFFGAPPCYNNIPLPEDAIKNSLDTLNIEKVKNLLSEYVLQVARNKCMDTYLLKRNLEGQIYSDIQTIESNGFDVTDLHRQKVMFFKSIDTSRNYKELINCIDKIYDTIFLSISNQLKNRRSEIVSSIINYVNQHYAEDLHLSDIAAAFHLNYTYLSSLFKRELKEGFTEYLNRIRIEKSKEIMRTRNIPLSQVSSIVGFSDNSYFSKVFRKVEGISPSTYKNIYKAK